MTFPKPVGGANQEAPTRVKASGAALTLAKVYFLVLGLAQQIALSWVLRDSYGALRGALSPASITYNPLVSAGVQGMSRAVSAHAEDRRPRRGQLLVHGGLALGLGAAFFCLAGLLADWLGSPYLAPGFRVLSAVVVLNGVYAPLVGVLNGQRRFLIQAFLDAFAATLRTVGLVAGAWLTVGHGSARAVVGAAWGFTLALGATVVLTAVLVFRAPSARGDWRRDAKAQLHYVGPVLVGQAVLNLLLQADTNTLRAFATRAATAAGLEATAADPLVGAYNAGQLFAFLPYQLLIAITFVLFPMLARARAGGDSHEAARLVRTGLRVATLLVGLVVSVSASIPDALLRLVFPENFAVLGAASMRVLCLGLGAFGLFGVLVTVLNSIGSQWLSLLVLIASFCLVVATNLLWVNGTPFGPLLLMRTAVATTAAVVVATLLAAWIVRRSVGPCIPYATLFRVVAVVASAILLGAQLPTLGKVATLGVSAAIAVAYVAALLLTRELRLSELPRRFRKGGRS